MDFERREKTSNPILRLIGNLSGRISGKAIDVILDKSDRNERVGKTVLIIHNVFNKIYYRWGTYYVVKDQEKWLIHDFE